MNQTPLTNMEGRWVHSTKEAFDALIEMGCKSLDSYRGHLNGIAVVGSKNIIYQFKNSSSIPDATKQAYYHKGHFYDQPYEEFTITEEKSPFPDRQDVEWIMVETPKWYKSKTMTINGSTIYVNNKSTDYVLFVSIFDDLKYINENSKDFKVTWQLKPKIDRRLHKNRPLALAIGRWIDENEGITFYGIGVQLEMVSVTCLKFAITEHKWNGVDDGIVEANIEGSFTIPDDYIIPDQVIEWMHEYEKEEQCKPST